MIIIALRYKVHAYRLGGLTSSPADPKGKGKAADKFAIAKWGEWETAENESGQSERRPRGTSLRQDRSASCGNGFRVLSFSHAGSSSGPRPARRSPAVSASYVKWRAATLSIPHYTRPYTPTFDPGLYRQWLAHPDDVRTGNTVAGVGYESGAT